MCVGECVVLYGGVVAVCDGYCCCGCVGDGVVGDVCVCCVVEGDCCVVVFDGEVCEGVVLSCDDECVVVVCEGGVCDFCVVGVDGEALCLVVWCSAVLYGCVCDVEC